MDPNETFPLGPGRDAPGGVGSPEPTPWLGRRKRVVAREVVSPEVAAVSAVASEMLDAASGAIRPMDVIDIPSIAPAPPEAIIDPTQFLERQRRPSHNRVYHLTQGALVVTLLASCGAFLGTLMEHRLRAVAVAAVACASAAVGVHLVRSSRLAHRLRGYVAAACVLALISVAACFVMPNFHSADPDDKKPPTTRPT
jgi:hypothetical protein